VIPAYNEEHRVAGCLESLREELERTPCEAEVIVVDNASYDRTAEIARSFADVTVVREPRKGLVAARNAGFLASSGDLIANIDADTIVPEGWLARVLREFKRNPALVALSGPYIYYDLPLLSRILVRAFYAVGFAVYVLNHYVLRVGAMLQGGNFIIRRDALLRAGGFDTSISFYGEDTDIAVRLAKLGRVKWTFSLPMFTSGRRLAKEGLFVMGVRYALNFFWMTFFKRPWTLTYDDIR
jgi:glycosyltransferase involved in cell wall biosynthesis